MPGLTNLIKKFSGQIDQPLEEIIVNFEKSVILKSRVSNSNIHKKIFGDLRDNHFAFNFVQRSFSTGKLVVEVSGELESVSSGVTAYALKTVPGPMSLLKIRFRYVLVTLIGVFILYEQYGQAQDYTFITLIALFFTAGLCLDILLVRRKFHINFNRAHQTFLDIVRTSKG